ncbi:MAG: AfsR/SARP family transcriptional regulator [Actinomycetota bacterium]
MGASRGPAWWRGLLPRRRRGPPAAIVLPDGSAVPSSFAAAILGRRERAAIERRRRGVLGGVPEAPGRLGGLAWGAGLRPSVDTVGPRAEALLRAWLEGVGREPPEVLCGLEAGDRVAFLLRGWITPRAFPRRPLREATGTVVSFRALRGLEPAGLSGGTALVAASVRGPLLPRLRPSPTVAADGLLVPVGFTEEGCLYIPLLGAPLGVSGERSAELLVALAVYAQMRMGPDVCRVLATEPLRPLLDAVVAVEVLRGSPQEIARALHELVLRHRREQLEAGALTHREVALSPTAPREPVVLAVLDADTAQQVKSGLPEFTGSGIGLVVLDDTDEPRRISLSAGQGQVRVAAELELLEVAPAVLSADALAEAAVVLRSAERREPVPPAEDVTVAASGTAPQSAVVETKGREPARAPDTAEPTARRRVLCLGGIRVFLGSEAVEGGWRKKALELLALLVAHREGRSREQVLGALWPDADPARSAGSLRQCLRQIRLRLEASKQETIVADWVDERLRLDVGAVWSDVRAFEEALEEARSAAEPSAPLHEAVNLYRGPFCNGHYYDWAIPIRGRLQREFVDASAELAELLARGDRYEEALQILDRAVEQDQFAEHLYRIAIALEGRRGRPEAARSRYQALSLLLADELGVEPTGETEAVYRRATES